MKQVQLIKLFIACPNDIKEEKRAISVIVDEINKTSGKHNNYMLECLGWETDTYTQIGEDPQDVINTQIDSAYDILIGLMWQTIGHPTKRDKSGTIEEINRAIQNRKQFLICFNIASPETLKVLDLVQLGEVNKFKQELTDRGVLYKEYTTIDGFESLFRIQLINLINDLVLPRDITSKSDVVKYTDISDLISEIESRGDEPDAFDAFELIEETTSSLHSIASSLNSMTLHMGYLTTNLENRTKELTLHNHIKDDRLRSSKVTTVVNLLASELDEFTNRLATEIPEFTKHFMPLGPAYVKILTFGKAYNIPEIVDLKASAIGLRNNTEGALHSLASMLKQITLWPPANSRFNKSRRETEIALKNLTKVMLEGLKLLNEALAS